MFILFCVCVFRFCIIVVVVVVVVVIIIIIITTTTTTTVFLQRLYVHARPVSPGIAQQIMSAVYTYGS
jgi:hypothetical protein